jgi:3-hydroxyacyl-CoA dehydrogenase/enoyl-CoA hydratase/3-hydroxybutyryl-CoA epimerase
MALFQSESVVVDRDADGAVSLVLDVPGRPFNMLTRQVMANLDQAVDALAGAGTVPLLVVRSGKPSGFLAGADIHEFLRVGNQAAAQALSAEGQRLFNKLAALPCPTLAAIAGPCLGGGLELALACDYRLVVDRPTTQLGLPEVELGLLPGWGGTQRLPRVVGLQRALQIILAGRRLNARDAFRWGLADALAATEAELRDQMAQLTGKAFGQGKRQLKGLPLRTWRQRFLESNAFGRRAILNGAERMIRAKVPDDMPAPLEVVAAVRKGLKEGMNEGLKYEREAAGRLAASPACQNLVTLFVQREQARKAPNAPDVKRVGVVGAGIMGAGIVQLAAVKGCEVVVQEINASALEAGLKRVDDLFRKAVERHVMGAEEAQQRRAAVKGTIAWEGFADLDVVVEAAVEDLEIKRNLFRELERRVGERTVLATNTSSLPLRQLTSGLSHPHRVAAMHFFNPVHKMPLVEVAGASSTDATATALLTRWAIALGKTPVLVGDSPGFVVNRILMPYLNEALLLLAEGLGIRDIDRIMKRFGMPMGPLELLDEIGLDLAAHVAKTMQPVLGERFEFNPAFEKMTAAGWLGNKKGIGFYLHKGRKKKTLNKAAEAMLREGKSAVALNLPLAARVADARERMVLLMVNEAAMALEEGLANADSIDLAMVFGTGWAPHRGGPLRYADTRGISDVVRALQTLADRLGKRFAACGELQKRSKLSGNFRGSHISE